MAEAETGEEAVTFIKAGTTADGKKSTKIYMQEDTAGNKYYSEFEDGSTAPVRTWTERPNEGQDERPWDVVLPDYHSQR
jgi:hypothetical protein